MPLRLLDGARLISARWADTGADLLGSPVALPGELAPAAAAAHAETARWAVRVDAFDPSDRVIGGYFADLEDERRRPVLTLQSEGRILGRARACRFHSASPGDQMHGFRFVLEAPLPPGPCILRDREQEPPLVTFERPQA